MLALLLLVGAWFGAGIVAGIALERFCRPCSWGCCQKRLDLESGSRETRSLNKRLPEQKGNDNTNAEHNFNMLSLPEMCIVTRTGQCFHIREDCASLKGRRGVQRLRPCGHCGGK